METERGRWFLAEYARRNRHAETEGLLESLGRIEKAVMQTRDSGELERFRLDVLEMSRAIARTRAEIAAIKPPESDGRILEASGELDSIVSATEHATSEILAAAERVQEVAWTLREAGADPSACDSLDQHAVAIYTSCSFQDLTAQRTRKVIDILGFLETRVNAMADIWDFTAEENAEGAKTSAPAPEALAAASLSAGPISQADIDFMLVEAELQKVDVEIEMAGATPAPLPISAHAPLYEGDLIAVPAEAAAAGPDPVIASKGTDAPSPIAPVEEAVPEASIAVAGVDPAPAIVPSVDDFLFEPAQAPAPPEGRPQLQVVGGAEAAFAKARSGKALSPDEAAAALDALKAMSVEERTRLFS